jgi:hypothetical protein
VRGRLAWARDPKGRETNLGQLVYQFQFNSDVSWLTWVYSDRIHDGVRCTALRDYKVELVDCDRLLPFVCELGISRFHIVIKGKGEFFDSLCHNLSDLDETWWDDVSVFENRTER